MHRQSTAILFLTILLLSGSGVGYMYCMHVARSQARRFEAEVAKDPAACTTITMKVDEFKLLEQEEIGEDIFEIIYEGNHYDIYKKEIHNGIIKLSARMDKLENELEINYKEKNSSQHIFSPLPFYNFHFFVEALLPSQNISIVLPEWNNIHPLIPSNFINKFSPPPDRLAA